MENCLVNRLKATINENSLPTFGNIIITLTPKGQATSGYIGIAALGTTYGTIRTTCTVEIIEGENVYLSDDGGTNFGTKTTYNSATASIKSSNNSPIGTVKLKVSKYDTFIIGESSAFNIEVMPEHLENATNLQGIIVPADWHSSDNEEVDLSFLKGKVPSLYFIGDTRRTYLSHLVDWFPNLTIINCNECRGTIYDAEPLANIAFLLSAYITGDLATFVSHKRTAGNTTGEIGTLRCNQVKLNNTTMANGNKNVVWDATSIIVTMSSPKNAYTIGASASKISELEGEGYTVTQCD